MNIINTLIERKTEYLLALFEHMQLSLFSLLIAILLAIPLAIVITRHKKIAESVLQITGIFQTIPSLALLGLLIPFIGIGNPPAIVALVIYALFPILQNTYTGLTDIDPSLEEAAEAFGMSKKEKLLKFELQLAFPHIIAGIRTAAVLIIGTATLAALIGAGGLGTFILLGIDRNNLDLILIGAISAALLAVLFNYGMHFLGKKTIKQVVITFFALFIALIGSFFYNPKPQSTKHVVIAGKLGAEPEIIINMYKLLIEASSDIAVTLKPNFGKTLFLFNALKSGDIDIYPEYTGTVLETLLTENTLKSHDPKTVYDYVKSHIYTQEKLVYLAPMLFQNTYAVAVKRDFASLHQLKTIADLKAIESQLTAGFTLEFIDRKEGYKGLQSQYHLTLNVQSMEPSLRYQAIAQDDVNVVDAYSTDSELKQYDLVTLQDPLRLFPPYQGAPLLKSSTLETYPELATILNQLAGKITETEISEMNYRVNIAHEAPADIAKQYLQSSGLLP